MSTILVKDKYKKYVAYQFEGFELSCPGQDEPKIVRYTAHDKDHMRCGICHLPYSNHGQHLHRNLLMCPGDWLMLCVNGKERDGYHKLDFWKAVEQIPWEENYQEEFPLSRFDKELDPH